jgi:hypothetical protein
MGLKMAEVAISVERERVIVPVLNMDDCKGVMTQKIRSMIFPARKTAQCLKCGVSRTQWLSDSAFDLRTQRQKINRVQVSSIQETRTFCGVRWRV